MYNLGLEDTVANKGLIPVDWPGSEVKSYLSRLGLPVDQVAFCKAGKATLSRLVEVDLADPVTALFDIFFPIHQLVGFFDQAGNVGIWTFGAGDADRG